MAVAGAVSFKTRLKGRRALWEGELNYEGSLSRGVRREGDFQGVMKAGGEGKASKASER